MDLIAALAALQGAATIVRSLRTIEGQLSTAEPRLKMANLKGYLADAKIELLRQRRGRSGWRIASVSEVAQPGGCER